MTSNLDPAALEAAIPPKCKMLLPSKYASDMDCEACGHIKGVACKEWHLWIRAKRKLNTLSHAGEGEPRPIAWITPETLADPLNDRPWTAGAIGEFSQRMKDDYTVALYATPRPDTAEEERKFSPEEYSQVLSLLWSGHASLRAIAIDGRHIDVLRDALERALSKPAPQAEPFDPSQFLTSDRLLELLRGYTGVEHLALADRLDAPETLALIKEALHRRNAILDQAEGVSEATLKAFDALITDLDNAMRGRPNVLDMWWRDCGTIRAKLAEVVAALARKAEGAPDSEGWIEWKGGDTSPFAEPDVVGRRRDGLLTGPNKPSEMIGWMHMDRGSDIVAYRLAPTQGKDDK